MKKIKVFDYQEELDCFTVTKEFKSIAYDLGIADWSPVVFIGRYFMGDNDYGEHWMDQWELRDQKREKVNQLGIEYTDMMIINSKLFADGEDGPCHTDELRKMFWTDVLKCLELSPEFLFEQARYINNLNKQHIPEEHINNLEDRILEIKEKLSS